MILAESRIFREFFSQRIYRSKSFTSQIVSLSFIIKIGANLAAGAQGVAAL
jgi:hypothetical protein